MSVNLEEIETDVEKRLQQMKLEEINKDIIISSVQKTAESVMNYCNRFDIPIAMKYTFIDMCVGEYLYFAESADLIDETKFRKSLKSITEGDVSYTYNTPEGRSMNIDNMISEFRDLNYIQVKRFRRMP